MKPWAMMNSAAASSSSTAHGRARRPRRVSTSRSSFCSSWRICSSSNGRNTITRSMRFRNSGRNDLRTASSTRAGRNRSGERSKPTGGPVAIDEPMFEVSMKTQRRKSTTRPCVSVRRPSSKTCRKRSQICGDAFSNSSSSTTENGSLRTAAISGAPERSTFVSESRRSIELGVWNSLMSMRTSREADPNMNSASAFASSVLPVPVGPTSSSTPSGRVGSLRPARAIEMRSTTPEIASPWPSTRSSKNARTSASGSGLDGSSIVSGRPGGGRERRQDVDARDLVAPLLQHLGARGRDEPQRVARAPRCPAGTAARARRPRRACPASRSRRRALPASAWCTTSIDSRSPSERTRITSNALAMRGRAATSASSSAGPTSPIMQISPLSMCGRSASSRPCGLFECWPA